MPSVTPVDEGTYCIDLEFQGQAGVIAAYLVEDAGERALIEIGPTSTLDTLLAALESIDVEPESISRVLVTHIHLDHAGASGTWLRRFPGAELFVHEVGAPHMIDPSRLLKSAARIYGDLMETLWGTVEPVPEDRMTILTDEDRIPVGDRTLVGLHTPGHAMHHVAFHDVDRETVFTGDVAAVRLQGIRFVQPATPPPEVDLELWDRSLDRLRGLRPRALYLTHFGPSRDVEWHLREAHEHLHEWGDLIRRAMESGQDRGAIVDTVRLFAESELLKVTDQPAATFRYDLAAGTGMSVDGYVRYFTKRAEAASPAS